MSAGGMSQGQIVAVVSAAALIVSLFLAWGSAGDIPDAPEIPEGTPGAEAIQGQVDAAEDAAEPTGWESQNTLDIYLAIVAGLVLVGGGMLLAGYPGGLPFAPAAATFLLGVIGAILTLYVLLDLPEGVDPGIGLFVALAAVAGVAIGSYLQMREELAELY